ncbi:hypothetical protein [Neisseria montereyensis]|uniref:Uncharacterized protein n=1 Tax=Neisseria montereyensis TaxID=2973938 RepID=A0ABT2FEB2_9NEIS|nr:hypothetical protein [Neisseria montereyensis]MCS4533850.1 hypothetical protein [Neisseria montereyensis]
MPITGYGFNHCKPSEKFSDGYCRGGLHIRPRTQTMPPIARPQKANPQNHQTFI